MPCFPSLDSSRESDVNQRLAVLRSVTIVSVSTYIEYALGLIVSIWIARALGPTVFGQYAFVVWLCGWLIVCSNHALTTSSTKFIAEADGGDAPEVASHIAFRLRQIQHLSSFVVVVLFVLVTLIVQPHDWMQNLLPMMAIIIVAVVAKSNYAMLVAIAKGQQHFEPEAIATVVTGVSGIGLVIAATLMHAGLFAFVAIFAIACLTLNLLNRMAYRRFAQLIVRGPIPESVSVRLKRHLRLTAVLVLLNSFKSRTIETFLLNAFASAAAVGYFAIAGTLTNGAVQLFSVGLTSTLLPYMAKSFGHSGTEFASRFLSEATRFYWCMGLAIAGIGLVATPGIVTLLYGSRYVDAIPAIQTILVLAGLLLLGNGISAFQTVVDRQDDRVRITVIALVVNAVLGLLLIPPYKLQGAVMAYAGTRIVELGLAIYYLRRVTKSALPVAAMLRLFAVGSLATTIAWFSMSVTTSSYAFIIGAAVFTLVYAPASVLVGYWTNEDFHLIEMITKRLGPVGRIALRGLESLRRLHQRMLR